MRSGVGGLAAFVYDDLGRRTRLLRGNETDANYGHDAVSRLTSLSQTFPYGGSNYTATFAYNPASQIVTRTAGNNFYPWTGHSNETIADTHNGLNQIVTTGSTSVSHDLRGNITGITVPGY